MFLTCNDCVGCKGGMEYETQSDYLGAEDEEALGLVPPLQESDEEEAQDVTNMNPGGTGPAKRQSRTFIRKSKWCSETCSYGCGCVYDAVGESEVVSCRDRWLSRKKNASSQYRASLAHKLSAMVFRDDKNIFCERYALHGRVFAVLMWDVSHCSEDVIACRSFWEVRVCVTRCVHHLVSIFLRQNGILLPVIVYFECILDLLSAKELRFGIHIAVILSARAFGVMFTVVLNTN